MKGSATLQLIDPLTKKVMDEVKHDNYITNFLNDFHQKLGEYPCIMNRQSTGIKMSDYMQGVILFEDDMPSSGCILPPENTVATGYAYNVYSGADTKRGTLNNIESGEITNGYRKVWDFGTNVAVGKISSLSLTTGAGASYDLNSYLKSSIKFNIGGMSTGSSGDYHPCMEISDKYALYCFIHDNRDAFNWGDFYWIPFNSNKVGYDYGRSFNYIGIDRALSNRERIYKPILQAAPTGYSRVAYPSIDNTYFYVLYYQANIGFKLHRYRLSDGSYVGETTYDFIYPTVPSRFKVTSDKIIWVNGDDVYWVNKSTLSQGSVLNTTGRTIRAFAISKKYPNHIFILCTNSLVGHDFAYAYVNLSTGGVWGQWGMGYPTYIYNDDIDYMNLHASSGIFVDEPLYISTIILGDGNDDGAISFDIILPPHTLSTINNLASPIIKTSDQVLKVIYDITW